MLHEIDSSNYEEVLSSTEYVFFDFWAPWCGPCKVMKPIFEKLADKFADREEITFATVNVDDNGDIAQHFQIMSIPTFILFKNKNIDHVFTGTVSEEAMEAEILKRLK